MITPITIKPEAKNKTGKYVFFACLGSAFIMMAVYMLLDKYQGIAGLAALIFITAAIYIYNRYVSAVYYYDVFLDSADNAVFLIRQMVGKRETTLCRVDLSSIVSVKAMSREDKKAYKPDKDTGRYAYSPTMFPEVIYLLEVRSAYEKADVFVELTEEQAGVLSDYTRIAREQAEA